MKIYFFELDPETGIYKAGCTDENGKRFIANAEGKFRAGRLHRKVLNLLGIRHAIFVCEVCFNTLAQTFATYHFLRAAF